MKNILTLILIAITLLACDKNQRTVKKLDGQWKSHKLILASQPTINLAAFGDLTLTFNECELEDDEYCTMNTSIKIVNQANTTESTGLFKVSGEGTELEFKPDEPSENSTQLDSIITAGTFKITDLSGDDLKMSKDGDIFEFKKQ